MKRLDNITDNRKSNSINFNNFPNQWKPLKHEPIVINKFIEENQLQPKDLARYLKLEHNFAGFRDTHNDH